MVAVILCGGLGTRLRSVVADRPKSLAPINGRPFLEMQLNYWRRQGVQKFILAAGYKSQLIEKFVLQRHWQDTEVVCEPKPLGTGGALLYALNSCDLSQRYENYLVLNGDTHFEVNLKSFKKSYDQLMPQGALALAQGPLTDQRYLRVGTNEHGFVTSMADQSPGNPWINGGVYIVRRRWVESWGYESGDSFSIENDIFKNSPARSLYGYHTEAKFIDIGVPEDYAKAQTLLKGINYEDHLAHTHTE